MALNTDYLVHHISFNLNDIVENLACFTPIALRENDSV
jgi:hypothetical protein